MVSRSSLRYVLRLANRGLAAIALAASILAAGPVLRPAVPLQASHSIPIVPAAAKSPALPLQTSHSVPAVPAPAASPAAPAAQAAGSGVIAYASRVTDDIHVMAPDGTGDRVLWAQPPAEIHWLEIDLEWRPDGRELAFTSEHENACSWYDSDIYAIRYNGSGYRRITNSPACAVLATLPQGSVTISVDNYTSTPIWVYVAGAPSVKWISGSGTVLFDKVADFGPGVRQPCIGVGGLPRFVCYPPPSGYPDVEPGKTLYGGNIVLMTYSGFRTFGAGPISWRADGSALAYGLRSNSNLWQISASPTYGATGIALPINEHTSSNLVAWGPTAETQDQYLYYSAANLLEEGYKGIWLNTVGDTSGGERLVALDDYDAKRVYDIEWLRDGSGFLFSLFYVGLGYFADILRYDFATGDITQLTDFPRDRDFVSRLSISPDGQQVVFDREADELNSDSSVWIMNIDGSDLHMLVDHAGRPAWGMTPLLPTPRAYVPVLFR